VVINLFNFFRHYKSPPTHSVIRIHLILLSYHILDILPSHFSSMEQMLMLMLHMNVAKAADTVMTMSEDDIRDIEYFLANLSPVAV